MKFFIIFKRDFRNIFLNPILLMYNTVFPILLVLVLGHLSYGSYSGYGITSYEYYGITILIYSALNVSVTASNSFLEESLKSSNLRIAYTPIDLSYIYLSKIAATFLFTSISLIGVIFLLQTLLEVNISKDIFPYVICILLVFNLFSSVMGVFLCCIFKSEELTNTILSLVNNVFAILGGLFFPINSFGSVVEKVSNISPVKWIMEEVFKIIYDGNTSFFIPIVISLSIASIILIGNCKLIFKMEDYL
ncbi:MAG TPA: ABC transporter permease [Tissierellales bacterium]|nr:ABC transporter permease [Tissierellales bacterium]